MQVLCSGYLAIQLGIFAKVILTFKDASKTLVASSAISFAAAADICILSYFEHARSIRPSTLVVLYLFASIAGLVPQLLLSTRGLGHGADFAVAAFQIGLELTLLLIECQTKESILKPSYQPLAPEEISGIFGRTFFWWINPVLKKGNERFLTHSDLPATDRKLSSETLRRNVLRRWDQRSRDISWYYAYWR